MSILQSWLLNVYINTLKFLLRKCARNQQNPKRLRGFIALICEPESALPQGPHLAQESPALNWAESVEIKPGASAWYLSPGRSWACTFWAARLSRTEARLIPTMLWPPLEETKAESGGKGAGAVNETAGADQGDSKETKICRLRWSIWTYFL